MSDESLPIRMLHDRVLIDAEASAKERRSGSGILIPATVQMGKRLNWAKVVAIGPKSLLLAPLLPMTVIDIPGTTIGSTAVDMLMAVVNDRALPERRLVAPRVE